MIAPGSRLRRARGLLAMIVAMSAAPALAETYPARTIAIITPANLPPDVAQVLGDAVQKARSTPNAVERLNAGGTEVFWSGPRDFSPFVKTEPVKWTAAIKQAGTEPSA